MAGIILTLTSLCKKIHCHANGIWNVVIQNIDKSAILFVKIHQAFFIFFCNKSDNNTKSTVRNCLLVKHHKRSPVENQK